MCSVSQVGGFECTDRNRMPGRLRSKDEDSATATKFCYATSALANQLCFNARPALSRPPPHTAGSPEPQAMPAPATHPTPPQAATAAAPPLKPSSHHHQPPQPPHPPHITDLQLLLCSNQRVALERFVDLSSHDALQPLLRGLFGWGCHCCCSRRSGGGGWTRL